MAYDLADIVPLTVQTKDATGAPANAGAVTVTITHAATGTVYTPTPTNPSTGQYQVDFAPTLAGFYKVRWAATGVNASGSSDSFQVYDAAPNYIISLADARSALGLTSTANDEDLRQYIEAATYVIERHLGEVVAPRSFVEDYEAVRTGRWGESITLRQIPVLSVQSITSVSNLFTWNASDFHINLTTGVITGLPSTYGLFGDVTINYTAGYAVIPANYQEAAKIIVQHTWQNRRGKSGAAVPGGMSTETRLGRGLFGFAIPNAALEWLGTGMTGIA